MELFKIVILALIVCVMVSRGQVTDPNGKFNPCQGTRTLNSLEAMKARGLVTKMGAKCVGSKIVQFISKHKVPTFAFPSFAKVFCQATIAVYSNFAAKDLTLATGTTAEDLLGVFTTLFKVTENNNWTAVDKSNGNVYHVPVTEFIDFGLDRLKCIMAVEKSPVKDANLILYTINHVLRLLSKN